MREDSILRIEIRDRVRRSHDWTLAIEELEREIEAVDDVGERSELLYEIARLTEELFVERERAIAIYQRAWKLNRENVKALTRAREAYGELGRLEMVAKVGVLELASRENDAELAALVGLAFLDCGEREKAIPLLETALEAFPDDMQLRDALAAASYDPDAWADDVERLSDDAQRSDSETAGRMLLRAARIVFHERPDDELYEELLQKALSQKPDDLATNYLYEKLLSAQERWAELEAHQQQRIDAAEGDAKQRLANEFALAWVQRFHDRERGASFFRTAIEQVSKNGNVGFRSLAAAFALVREIYGAKSQWDDVLALADGILSHLTEEDQRLFVALQAAMIAWKELGDPERARGYFGIVRELEDNCVDLLAFEEEHGRGQAGEVEPQDTDSDPERSSEVDTDESDDSEERPMAVSAPEETPVVEDISPELQEAMDAARSLEEESADAAVDAWRKVVRDNPSMRTPRREQVRLLRSLEQWPAVVEALKDENAKATTTDGERVAVLRELADAYREVGNDVLVVNTYNAILKLSPDDVSVLDALAGQYEHMKRWPDLVGTLQKKAALLSPGDEQIELYLRIAKLYIERFSNQAEAIKAFEKVLEADPENEEACQHLLAVYEKRRDWEKLIALKEREIDRADASERFEKTYDVAKLAATRVKKPDICTHWWEKVREFEPDHPEAIAELEKLYERGKNWEGLAEVCSSKARIATDAKSQIDALQKLGLLYTDRVENPDKAIAAWRRLLEIDSNHRRAQDSLKKLLVATGAWDELEAFYRSADKLDEFVRVLERQLDVVPEEAKIPLALKIARTYRDEIEKPDRALRAFERVLSIDENNLEAAEALIPLYKEGRDPRKLVTALEVQLAQTDDPALRQERMKELAEYCEETLRDSGAALGWWLRAHEEDYEALWIREHVERLAEATQAWPQLVDAYEASVERFSEPKDALGLMVVIAEVLESHLGDLDKALAINTRILEIDDTNESAINALERLYLGRERYDELLAIYERKLQFALDSDTRREVEHKVAQLYEDEIKDDDKAIETYESILDADGEDLIALQALDRIFTRTERWDDLHRIIGRQLLIVDPHEAPHEFVPLKLRLAQVREEHLEDVPGAIRAYQEVLELQSDNDAARRGLEKYLADGDHRLEAANTLEPIYREGNAWQSLVEAHEIQLEAMDDPFQKMELLVSIGEIYSQKLGQPELSFQALCRAFRLDPTVQRVKEALLELSLLIDDGASQLVKLFEEALENDDQEPAITYELSLKVARAYDEHLSDTGKAVQYYRRALSVEPDDETCIEALDRIFSREEKYPELLEVYRKKVEVARDPQARLDLLLRIAVIYEEMLESLPDAVAAYSEILDHDGENLQALQALDRLYRQGEQWHELGDILSRRLVLCDETAERVELLVRLAALREAELDELAGAVETYRQVLELDPENQAAVAALERLMANEDYALSVAQILEPIYASHGEWSKRVAVYSIISDNTYDPEQKIQLLHSIAELYEVGGDDCSAAFDAYAKAFREDPRNEVTHQQLERLARMLDRWTDVVSLYDEVVDAVGDEELRIALLTRVAQIYEHELSADEFAVSSLKRILEMSPHTQTAHASIIAIHERNANYTALVEALQTKAEVLVDLSERKALLYRSAQIREEILENPEAAAQVYESILELDSMDTDAMAALERLYTQLERWEPLKDVYTAQVDQVDSPDEKGRIYAALGELYEQKLQDTDKAIETYQSILDLDDSDTTTLRALDRLFTNGERWYELLGNLERQLELATVVPEQVELGYRIGQLWQSELNDMARAVETFQKVLELDPQHAGTLEALHGVLHGDSEPLLAASVLEPLFRASGEVERLIDVLEVMVQHADDTQARVEFLHRIAELYEVNLDRNTDAFSAHARALKGDNGNQVTLGNLERLAGMDHRWPELCAIYLEEAEKSLDVPRQVELLGRLARIYEEELGQPTEAMDVLARILDAEFDNREAMAGLDRLYTAHERWEPLVDILRREIQLATSDDEILDIQFRLGRVQEESLANVPGAIEAYQDILSTHPEHMPTLQALEMLLDQGQCEAEISAILEPLYENAGQFDKYHHILEVQLSKLADVMDRQGMYQRLAEVAEHKLFDLARAFAWWAQALSEDSSSELAVEEAERLAGAADTWPRLVEVYSQLAERPLERELQVQTMLRLGRVMDAEMGNPSGAIETYLRVLQIDEREPDALAALDRLYTSAGMHQELVEILRRRAEVTLDGDEIVELNLRRGQVFADALLDSDAALACYEQILEQDSRNRRALLAQEQVFFHRQAWNELYEVYERLVDVAEGDEEMANLYARMARIASDALDNVEAAADLWGRVLDIRGDEPQALTALEELYGRQEMWEELIEVLERHVCVVEPVAQQVALYKMLGRIWDEKLSREQSSLDSWLVAHELDPTDTETLRALAALYRATQSWEELSQILLRLIEVAQSSSELSEDDLIDLYAQLGQLEGELLGRVPEAVEAWRRVLAIDGGNFDAMHALEQLFTREARWEECIEILERRAMMVEEPSERINTLLQVGAIWEEKVQDLDSAANVYLRVQEAEPSNAMASRRLEAIYREQYKWNELNGILLERVDYTEDVSAQIELLAQIAKIYEEELGDEDSAYMVLEAAFQKDYAHESIAQELERLATAAGKWEELLGAYTGFVTVLEGEDVKKACNLWVQIGRWYGERLNNMEGAIYSAQACLRLDPDHLGALTALADFQRKSALWPDLSDTLKRIGELEPELENKAKTYIALAQLLETHMQDDGRALDAYRLALGADPSSEEALTALQRLYQKYENWQQLIDILGRKAELESDEAEILRLKIEIGSLWDIRLSDSGQAIQAYKSVLELDPSNLSALRALEHLYERTGESEAYLDILEAQLDMSPSDAEQISLYERMSSAWEERFGKLDRAAECYERIVALDERNFPAYEELARLYRQEKRWDSLVDAYRGHILATQDASERVRLYCLTGEVYERQLSDYDHAIEAYTDVLAFEPDSEVALDALGRLYERIEEWDRAIDIMRQLAETIGDSAKKADLHYRIGRITYRQLHDAQEAEEHFLKGLTINESHVPIMEELVAIYSERADWLKAAQMMVRAESHTANVLEKVRFLHDAALLYLERLQQVESAKTYFAGVLAIDPEHVSAGEYIAELYFQLEEWGPLSDVLEMLVRKAPQRELDSEQLLQLYYRTAKAADELGDFERADEYYKAAYDIDPTYLPVLTGRGNLLYKKGDWDGAGKIYQTILAQHRDSQDEQQVVRTRYQLGMVRLKLQERRKALNMFEKALEIDPGHRDSLEAIISIQEQQGDYEAVIHAKRGLLATADDPEKVELLTSIAELYAEKLNNAPKAISTVLEALDILPKDRTLLQRLLALYTETEQWKNAVATIDQFIELEEGMRKGSYYQAAATICRDKLLALDEAIEYYDSALDCFFVNGSEGIPKDFLPRALKSFSDIDKILTTKRDWKNQERAYRKMIKRLNPGDPILIQLWHALGEIYRSRLKSYESSIAAFEVAQTLDPKNMGRREILAELYVLSGPDQADKAVQQHMAMLRDEPFKYDSYRALRRLYIDTQQYDKAWCLCNALVFLGKADEDEQKYFGEYKPKGFVRARQRITEELWRQVRHENENPYVSAIFGAIWQGAAMIRALPIKKFYKQLRLKAKDRLPPDDQLQFSKILRYVGEVMNTRLPDVYLQPDTQGEIAFVNVHEKNMLAPSIVVFSRMLQGRPEREIAFVVAQWLNRLRPDHFLKVALPTNTELKAAFFSAVALVRPDFPVPPDMQAAVTQYLPEMQKRIQPQWLEQLGLVVNSFLSNAPEINLNQWGYGVDATGHRLGFILCGDLTVAASIIQSEPVAVGAPQSKEKTTDLLLYSISEDYFAVRAHLGLGIG